MKSFLSIFTVLGLVFSMIFPQEASCRERENLYYILKDSKEIRTYIAGVTDSSGKCVDMIAPIRKHLEDALVTRMTLNFVLVQDKDDADITISCDIIERVWMENDPIDQIHGLSTIALDAAIQQEYARLRAVFTVTRGPGKMLFKRAERILRRRNILWQNEIKATIDKKGMTEEQSKPLLEERIAEVFMRECFSKTADLKGSHGMPMGPESS